ncbi:hypothetical protein H074_36094 [Amycolatopsis decaplanina DSM 44594]|uniref:Uncharacterized protein n=1 Tax=Amycolatopsis decaplanina DSM 44594 TaxID=1284240 RepID=M2XRF1_9PSEU|nr:hypothetical protein H074_36094 [Amycolatopsis decaplanina DSM 44594]
MADCDKRRIGRWNSAQLIDIERISKEFCVLLRVQDRAAAPCHCGPDGRQRNALLPGAISETAQRDVKSFSRGRFLGFPERGLQVRGRWTADSSSRTTMALSEHPAPGEGSQNAGGEKPSEPDGDERYDVIVAFGSRLNGRRSGDRRWYPLG